tara:strand:- start:1681 stop:2538 length:858 start_codon:yes stop_codon:yes gene_type:complete
MKLKQIKVDDIKANPLQPREHFDKVKLKELGSSIKQHGLINPIRVKKEGSKYVIVAGERRWKAHQIAKIPKIFSIESGYENTTKEAIHSLIENIQRVNLNPMEKARFIKALKEDTKYNQAILAKLLGVAQPVIHEALSLVDAPKRTIDAVEKEVIGQREANILQKLEPGKQQEVLTELNEEWEKQPQEDRVTKREFVHSKVQKKLVEEKKKSEMTVIDMGKFERPLERQLAKLSRELGRTEEVVRLYRKKKLFSNFSDKFWESWNVFERTLSDFNDLIERVGETK